MAKGALRQKRGRADDNSNETSTMPIAVPTSFSEARLLWLEAPSAAALQAVEGFYKLQMSTLKAKRGNGPLTDVEVDIRNRLVMLLMQSGRAEQCVTGLTQLGCKVRLASCVLDYVFPPPVTPTVLTPTAAPCIAADWALLPSDFRALRSALGPLDAHYWTAHNYSVEPPSPYFSFVLPTSTSQLEGVDNQYGPLGALITSVYQLGLRRFGAERMGKVQFAELWGHNRPHASGHQLHYDSDDEGRGGIRNPIVSSVLFLQGDVGGPTLVTTQRLADKQLCESGWLCYPKEGRSLVFDGSVLHGVIPGKGVSPSVGERRVTVMVALWEKIQIRPGDGPGSARPFPDMRAPQQAQWVKDLTTYDAVKSKPSASAQTAHAALPSSTVPMLTPEELPRVWERVDGTPVPHGAPICAYDQVYQGF